MNSQNLIIPLMLAAMAVFMFISIRNQKKRAAAAADMQQSVVSGSRVQLHSGLFGTVVDASSDEKVDLEVAPGVVTEWNRMAIREVISDGDAVDVPDSPADLERVDDGDEVSTDDEPGSARDHTSDEKPEEK